MPCKVQQDAWRPPNRVLGSAQWPRICTIHRCWGNFRLDFWRYLSRTNILNFQSCRQFGFRGEDSLPLPDHIRHEPLDESRCSFSVLWHPWGVQSQICLCTSSWGLGLRGLQQPNNPWSQWSTECIRPASDHREASSCREAQRGMQEADKNPNSIQAAGTQKKATLQISCILERSTLESLLRYGIVRQNNLAFWDGSHWIDCMAFGAMQMHLWVPCYQVLSKHLHLSWPWQMLPVLSLMYRLETPCKIAQECILHVTQVLRGASEGWTVSGSLFRNLWQAFHQMLGKMARVVWWLSHATCIILRALTLCEWEACSLLGIVNKM